MHRLMPRSPAATSNAEVGTAAPDVVLQDSAGKEIRLSDLWTGAPSALVLVFFRHFG